jgi:hypothetical protein
MKKHGSGKLLQPKDISTRLQRKLHNKTFKVIQQYTSAVITIIFFRDITTCQTITPNFRHNITQTFAS